MRLRVVCFGILVVLHLRLFCFLLSVFWVYLMNHITAISLFAMTFSKVSAVFLIFLFLRVSQNHTSMPKNLRSYHFLKELLFLLLLLLLLPSFFNGNIASVLISLRGFIVRESTFVSITALSRLLPLITNTISLSSLITS